MSVDVTIRNATPNDNKILFQLIYDLAKFQGIQDRLTINEQSLNDLLFSPNANTTIVVALIEDKIVGFTQYSIMNINRLYQSTPALYIDEMYVLPEFRYQNIGKKLFHFLAKVAAEKKYNRLEWWVVQGNTQAEDFYLGLGAIPFPEYKVWRLKEEGLQKLSSCNSTAYVDV